MIISRNSRNNDASHATNTFGEQQSTLVSFFFPYIFVALFTSKHKHIRVYTNKIDTWNATLFDSARKWTRQCTSKTRKKRREEGSKREKKKRQEKDVANDGANVSEISSPFSSARRRRRRPLLFQRRAPENAPHVRVSIFRLLLHPRRERFSKTLVPRVGGPFRRRLENIEQRRVAKARLLFCMGQTLQSRRSAERTIRGWLIS